MLKQLRNAASERRGRKKQMSKPVASSRVKKRIKKTCVIEITCVCAFPLDAILNMVNNIAANVLGGKPELEGGAETGGTHP